MGAWDQRSGSWVQDASGKWSWQFGSGCGEWRWPSTHPSNSQATEWLCNACGTVNWTPKTKCSRCGIKKSWAQVVRSLSAEQAPPSTTSTAVPPKQNLVRAQLDQVSASLAKMVGAPPPVGTASVAASPPVMSGPSRAEVSILPTSVATKAKISAKIKSLEAAVSHLPEDPEFDPQREALATKISELKRELTDAKPIGARIDGARAALQRSQDRRADAQCALALAQKVVEAADAEVDKIAADLCDFESALAHSPPELAGAPLEAVNT